MARTPEAEITFRFLAAPMDAGQSGSVSAGRVLEWIDKAGYAAAVQWCGTYAVTAYVGNIRFTRPIEVGHLVEVRARVIHTGRSSMHILCETFSGPAETGELETNARCLVLFVSVDEHGRSQPVPVLEPKDEVGRLLQEWALRRARVRADVEKAMEGQKYTSAGTAPRVVLRFLAAPTDVNWGGNVHGGNVMEWIDEAAHVLATQWSGSAKNVATFTGGVRFYKPMHIGDLIEVEARLLHTGRTTMHIGVHCRAGDPATGEMVETTYCRTIFVGLDEERSAVPVKPWVPVSDEDMALDEHAVDLVEIRARHEGTA